MRKLKLVVAIGVLALSAWIVQAAEDGLGTNVVRNLRVKTDGTISLGAVAITNWGQIESTNAYTKAEIDALGNGISNAFEAADGGISNDYIAADGVLRTDFVAADLGISNAYIAADGVVSAAYRAADGGISNDFIARDIGISNALNNASNVLRTDFVAADLGISNAYIAADGVVSAAYRAADAGISNDFIAADGGISNAFIAADGGISNAYIAADLLKLDMTGGGATNLTVNNLAVSTKFVQNPGSLQTIVVDGGIDPAAGPFIPITGSAVGDQTAYLMPGANAGQMVILLGRSDVNTVTLTNGVLADGVPFTFKNQHTMQLIWNNTDSTWIELNRTAK